MSSPGKPKAPKRLRLEGIVASGKVVSGPSALMV
jgi:hypothetical protein